jgi:hypothetical protein
VIHCNMEGLGKEQKYRRYMYMYCNCLHVMGAFETRSLRAAVPPLAHKDKFKSLDSYIYLLSKDPNADTAVEYRTMHTRAACMAYTVRLHSRPINIDRVARFLSMRGIG